MKKRVVYLGLLLLVPIFFAIQPAFGQLGYVNGTVVDADGNPVKDVVIRIEGMNIARKYKLKTNKEGEYLHAGISMQGIYRVIAEKEGFQTDYVENVKPGFSRDEERSTVNFTLRPGEASAKLAFEMTDEERAKMQREAEEARKRAERLAAVRETFQQGVDLFNAGQYQEAANAFEKVLETDSEQPSVWANLANSYSKLENWEKALQAYDKAIELDPENASYMQNQGSVYASMGDTENARAMYERAASSSAATDPKGAAVNYYNMGVTYINAGQNEEAREALNKAIELDPSHAEAHYQLGLTLLGMNDTEAAIERLQQYLKLAPNSENAPVAQALIEQMGG